MANYKTGKCDFTTTEWEQVDSSSREQVANLLSTALSDYTDDIAFSSGACSWDISCHFLGKESVWEIKDRNMSSTRYNDVMVEVDKFENNQKYCPGFAIFAVNMFNDGIIAFN
jgi:hypothetical protein